MATARAVNDKVGELKEELSQLYESKELDAFGLYLYGIVLREQDMDEQARTVLAESVNAYPWNWSAWTDLARLCTENETVQGLFRQLEPHWMRYFFLAYVTLELQQNEQSLEYYSFLSPHFPNSTYIAAQMAIGNYNVREFDVAQEHFEAVQLADPYRLEDLDAYSNILYVKGSRAQLSHLAHRSNKTDKYRPETCCIIGNYYSLKQEHEKAVVYFRRALKLDKNYLSAWTLMGHEYVELKNTPAAVEAYRRAVEINPRDYRAWYGLGQTYEILRLPFYSLYYYHKATQLRPYDARMWTAMGGCYEELNRIQEAIDCYQRAGGKKEGDSLTLFKLAKLYVALDDRHAAAKHFMACLYKNDADEVEGGNQTIEALLFLANYHKDAGRLDQAEQCCSRLLDYTGHPREEARAIMREIRAMHMHNPVARAMESTRFGGAFGE